MTKNQSQNSDLSEIKQIIYHSEGIHKSYPKMYFLLNLSHCLKRCAHFCQILFFTMPAHQIWSCHVTQDAEFEIFYFVLILYSILRKVTVEKLFTSEVISQKTSQGGGGVEQRQYPIEKLKYWTVAFSYCSLGYDKLLFKMIVYCNNSYVSAVEGYAKGGRPRG